MKSRFILEDEDIKILTKQSNNVDLNELLFLRDYQLNLVFNANPYHDMLGKFTWSPFGKYKGNYKEATSLWGKDYRQIMKDFDVDSLTQEELDMIDSYLFSPQIGNSFDKNGAYTTTNYFTDNEGNELTGDKLKEAQELYDLYWGSKSWDLSFDEKEKYQKEFEEKGYHINKEYLRPSIQIALFNEQTMNQPDIYKDTLTLYDEAKAIKQPEHSWEETDLQKSARLYIDWFERQKQYVDVDSKVKYTQEAKDQAKKILNGEAKALNTFKYGNDKSSYITPSYQSNKWNSDAVGISAVELSTWPESKIQKYIDFYSQNSRDTYLASKLKNELTSRKFDKLISEKGVSLDHDVVVTRRIKDTTLIRQELGQTGYFIQEGFTSTTAANNIAKKSPGNMVFGDNVLKIVIPAGTKFLPVESVIKQKFNDDESTMALARQHEIILPSKTKYISGNSESKNNLETIDTWNQDKFDSSLEIPKLTSGNNDVYSLVAITDEYQRNH